MLTTKRIGMKHPSVTDPTKPDPTEIVALPDELSASPRPGEISELTRAGFFLPDAKVENPMRRVYYVFIIKIKLSNPVAFPRKPDENLDLVGTVTEGCNETIHDSLYYQNIVGSIIIEFRHKYLNEFKLFRRK